ncbi:MAG: ABC transporter ATP-binding protein, partial [Acidimicrobiales bacterium]
MSTPGSGSDSPASGNGSGDGHVPTGAELVAGLDVAGNGSTGNGSNGGGGVSAPESPTVVKPPAGEARNFGPRPMLGVPMEKSEDFKNSTLRLANRLRPERIRIVLVVVLAIISVCMTVVGPRILGHATNIIVAGVYGPTRGIDFTALHHTLELAAGLYLGAALLSYSQGWLLAGVVQRSMHRLRADVEDKLNTLPLKYVDGQPRGDLLSRVTNDIDNVAQSLQQTLSMMLTSSLTIVGVLLMMYLISPLLATVALITIPLSLWLIKFIASRSKTRFVAQWTHTGALNAQVEEVFTGHSLVKVFGRQADSELTFSDKNQELFVASFWAQFISGIIQPAMMFVGNLNFVIIAVVGGLKVASGSLSLGDVQAFIQYSRQFTQPLTQLASMANVLQSGVASAERVFELLDVDEQSVDPADPLIDVAPRGRVAFEHVSFSYDPAERLIQHLDLSVEPGQTVAIVGPTGAGKTTLVNLIMRFYELDGGRITLDGVDITQLRRDTLRGQIGMVLQDTWLFGGTIRDNIAYGRPGAADEEVQAAARATYVDRFVHSLPDGYDTVLDAEGGNISAGEKQLITIARAFLSDPALLILDEATSSVDTRTELLVQQAMSALRKDRTSFVIAHRLSTIRDADVILVMRDGQIVEQGSHEDLLARGGAY